MKIMKNHAKLKRVVIMSNKNNEYDLEVLVERFDSCQRENPLNHQTLMMRLVRRQCTRSATYMMSLGCNLSRLLMETVPDDALTRLGSGVLSSWIWLKGFAHS